MQGAWVQSLVRKLDPTCHNKDQRSCMPQLRPSSVVAVQLLSCVQLFVTPWTVAHQALLSKAFSWQEYRSRLPFPSPGDLPDSGIEPRSPHCRQTLYHLSHQGGSISNSASCKQNPHSFVGLPLPCRIPHLPGGLRQTPGKHSHHLPLRYPPLHLVSGFHPQTHLRHVQVVSSLLGR